MTYIKLSSDFVSIDTLSRIAKLPKSAIEQYFNNLFTMASQYDNLDNLISDSRYTKLGLYLALEKLGLADEIIGTLLEAYASSNLDINRMLVDTNSVLDDYGVESSTAVKVLDVLADAFNS